MRSGTIPSRRAPSDLTMHDSGRLASRVLAAGASGRVLNEVRILANHPRLCAYFASQIETFDPDIILISTDDPAHPLLEVV